ncbi:MAG TPA: response regulator transcription factor [Actinomycetota bacterium]
MAERILLIEDDRRVRRTTALALADEGYEVLEAADGETGLTLLAEQRPDLVVLDVMLPGRDGFEICRAIRKESELPIIFLTAKTDTVDVVVGLESGGDDYLTKPFAVRELIARIRALLRRSRTEHRQHRITVADVVIDVDGGAVAKAGAPIGLTKTEFNLLRTMAERPNQVFSRELLLEKVWGYDYLGDSRLVDVHIRRLRAKIETDASNPSIIQTVRGLGYKVSIEQ